MIVKIVTESELLRVPCETVKDGDVIAEITHNLIDTAEFNDKNTIGGCAGLAANQIGYNKRIFVVKINDKFRPIINPEIVKTWPGMVSKSERCLSFPEKDRKVRRYKRIRLEFNDAQTGERIQFNFKGFTARCIQHEIDHLNGVHI